MATSLNRGSWACFFAAAMALSAVCHAQLFEEDFNVDPTASWTVNDPGLSDVTADFFYDYSAIGVPAAPNGSGTIGLKMTANNSGGVFSGFSVSPTGESFTGDYRVSFDLWQNYVGPLGVGGSGSTQLSMFGIGTAGNVAVWPGSAPKESVMFGVTLDGGSAIDFRAYSSVAPAVYPNGDPVYLAPGGETNGSDPYYAGFGGAGAPAAQLLGFPGQTGVTDAGEPAFAWRRVVIEVVDDEATWSIDGLPIARVDLATVTLGGGNLLFGHSDVNASSSTDPNDNSLNVTLIDNVLVEAIGGGGGPSPVEIPTLGHLGLALMAGLLALAGRSTLRRRARGSAPARRPAPPGLRGQEAGSRSHGLSQRRGFPKPRNRGARIGSGVRNSAPAPNTGSSTAPTISAPCKPRSSGAVASKTVASR